MPLAFACSDDPGASPDPCEGNDPSAECEVSCAAGASCPFGTYCDVGADECRADCQVGTTDCGDGMICTTSGQCAEDEDPVDCPDVSLLLTPQIPTVVLLVDQSGSMNSNLAPNLSRWDAVKDALLDPTDGVVTTLEDRVNFGASLYSSNGGNAGGACPILNETLPQAGGYIAIKTLFDANSPNADTPTAESVDSVTINFESAGGPKVIVLATDGSPDNCVDANAHNQASRDMSETAVQNAFSQDISTFVMSVGDQVAESHLQRLANAGQGLDLDLTSANGAADFYVATDPTLLKDAFETIIRGVRTCEVDLDQPVNPSRAGEGTVSLNGAELVFGVDWRLIDDDTIELLGAACDSLLNDEVVQIEASFPCGVVIE